MSKENEQQSKLEIKRHSLAHVLAAAVLEVFPETKFGYGPPVENGFYYDFELPRTLVPEDLPIIEEKMKNIIKQNFPLEHKTISIEEAKSHYDKLNQKYKLELLEDLEKEGYKEVSVYKLGQFVDLCNGPHLESAGEINADSFKLTRISGAYWKGDENQPMLQRVYGVAFNNKKELKKYLKELEEAEKRNHRKIGKEMDLFANFEEIGQGLPVWLPNGYAMRKTLEDYMLKMERLYGYEHIATPHINKAELFEKSGHLGFYQDSMYSPIEIDGQTFYLKPMNCPAAMMVYKRKPYSYRDLPYKLGEFGTVYRYEKSGELHGLQRVRGFTQNDAHVFCTSDQLKSQIKEILEMMVKFYINLGFENYKFRLSLSDPENDKYIGSKEDWQEAEDTIRQVLQEEKMEFTEKKGEAVFYGPKIDVQAVNVFGKEDTISTIQIDFNLPERFDLNYIDKNGDKKRPFVIHRALIGSMERFFAFLIEYYAGKFPLWLAPKQVKILPVSDKFNEYARKIKRQLLEKDIRVELDDSDESLGKKIAEATTQKVPYMLVVGEKEKESDSVAVRHREGKKQEVLKVDEFLKKVEDEIINKK